MTVPARAFAVALLAGGGLSAGSAAAQARLDEPPRIEHAAPAGPSSPAPAAAPSALPPGAAPVPAAAGPVETADWPLAREASATTTIEQRKVGNRVVEIVVTPAGSARSYSIVNREGQRPVAPQELSSGLSTPRFLRFDF